MIFVELTDTAPPLIADIGGGHYVVGYGGEIFSVMVAPSPSGPARWEYTLDGQQSTATHPDAMTALMSALYTARAVVLEKAARGMSDD